MSYLKKRIAIFLCMVMAFTTVFCVMPQEQVRAASKVQFSWSFGLDDGTVKKAEIELGAENLYIGDYVTVTGTTYHYLSNNSGVSYKSSDKNIIEVDKNGKITAKKTGTATITIKFKGTTGKCKLTVVESLASFRTGMTEYETAKTVCEKLIRAYGTGITNKNRYKVLKAYKEFHNTIHYNSLYIQYVDGVRTYKICNPIAARTEAVSSMVKKYGSDRNPLATSQGKQFKVKSITGKGTKITINLKSKITQEQIVGIQFGTVLDGKVTAEKTSTVKLKLLLCQPGKNMECTATVKRGSRQITIKTSKKMTKGKMYFLGGNSAYVAWLMSGSGNINYFTAQ